MLKDSSKVSIPKVHCAFVLHKFQFLCFGLAIYLTLFAFAIYFSLYSLEQYGEDSCERWGQKETRGICK